MNNYMKTIISGLKQWVSSQKSDWNQNDSSAANFIKNRPFYSEEKEKVLLQVTDVYGEQDGDVYYVQFKNTPTLVIGQKYIVNFNGVDYICEAYYYSDWGTNVLGNGELGGLSGGNGEPFCFNNYSDGWGYLTTSTDGPHSFSISGTVEVVHQIDKKYVPVPDLADVAHTGNYWDLVDTPYIPWDTVQYAVSQSIPDSNKKIARDNIGASSATNLLNGGAHASLKSYGALESSGMYSVALGANTKASGDYSHAEGRGTTASENASHAEGLNTTSSGAYSHAEGYNTTSSGSSSHAEGEDTIASGHRSHAEGIETTASGQASHAEGSHNTASGNFSHAEGNSTIASSDCSHAEGSGTIASSIAQHVQGRYNIESASQYTYGKYAHIVGNGESDTARSNAHTLDWNGVGWFAGGLKVGGTGQDDPNAVEVALKSDLTSISSTAITTAQIDEICNQAIYSTSEVEF